MTLPKTSPTAFCVAFVEQELTEYKKKKIHKPYWSIMERVIARSDEFKLVFNELIHKFGYVDHMEDMDHLEDEDTESDNSSVQLILEYIWFSASFNKNEVGSAKSELAQIHELRSDIIKLSEKLASKLRTYDDLCGRSGRWVREEYQSVTDMLNLASQDNGWYQTRLSDELKKLYTQYDWKYWPDRADCVEAVGVFEQDHPVLMHAEIPNSILESRNSRTKSYVTTFDCKLQDILDHISNYHRNLDEDFRFSDNAMAEITNVILELPPERLVTKDAVRVVRNRNKKEALCDAF